MKKAAMNILVHLLWTYVFILLGKKLSGIVDRRVSVCFNLLETASLPKRLCRYTLSPTVCESAKASPPPSLGMVNLFNCPIPWVCNGISRSTLLAA